MSPVLELAFREAEARLARKLDHAARGALQAIHLRVAVLKQQLARKRIDADL